MNIYIHALCSTVVLLSSYAPASAQLNLSAQLRTRTEFRNGQGDPLPHGTDPAFFTSQRTRINAGFSTYRLRLGLTIQDVRVWGQDVSSINRTTVQDNNGTMLHQAWAEIDLTDTSNKKFLFQGKFGRQELIYDDQRLLGNLDWLQQGRRHDAAVLKMASGNWQMHIGFAFNQNKEKNAGTLYNPTPPGAYGGNTNKGSMYKSFQYMHINRKYKGGNVSLLFFNDQFTRYEKLIENNTLTKTFTKGNWNRTTTGLFTNNIFEKTTVTAAAYAQIGQNAEGEKLADMLLSATIMQQLDDKWQIGAGWDYTTRLFDPLYGTPHKFWGLMDYFYAGNSFGKNSLSNYYLKARYKASKSLQLAMDCHQFHKFGTELDLVGNYTLTENIGIELGYGHFLATPQLVANGVKAVANARQSNNWAYFMININPSLLLKPR